VEVIRGEAVGRKEKGRKKEVSVARGYDRSQELRQRRFDAHGWSSRVRLCHLQALVRIRKIIFCLAPSFLERLIFIASW